MLAATSITRTENKGLLAHTHYMHVLTLARLRPHVHVHRPRPMSQHAAAAAAAAAAGAVGRLIKKGKRQGLPTAPPRRERRRRVSGQWSARRRREVAKAARRTSGSRAATGRRAELWHAVHEARVRARGPVTVFLAHRYGWAGACHHTSQYPTLALSHKGNRATVGRATRRGRGASGAVPDRTIAAPPASRRPPQVDFS